MKMGIKAPHPGVILREEFLEPMGISQTRLARDIGVSYLRINEICTGKRGITTDTAIRLARYFDTMPEFWLNAGRCYDLQKAETEHAGEYDKIKTVEV